MLTLSGAGQPQNGVGIEERFVISVKTDNAGTSADNEFTLPWIGTYDVDWGDGSKQTGATDSQTHTYAAAGDYDIKVKAATGRIYFNNSGDKLKIIDIVNWGVDDWTSFENSFWGCQNLTNITATDLPNLTNVLRMGSMFRDCLNLVSIDVSTWDLTNITSLANGYLYGMFYGCTNLITIDVSNWNTSNVIEMQGLFRLCSNLTTLDVSNWNTISLINGRMLFDGCSSLTTLDVSNWDVSSVTTIRNMFANTGITSLDVSNWNSPNLNEIQYWLVGSPVSGLIDVSNWNVSNVTKMLFVLSNNNPAQLIIPSLANWNISNVTNWGSFMRGEQGLSTEDYDATLISWAAQTPRLNQSVSFSNSQYTYEGAAAKQTLIDTYGWTITDGGQAVSPEFVISVKTDNTGTSNDDQFTLSWIGAYDVDWGDGVIETGLANTQTHTYVSVGTYNVKVTAASGRIKFRSNNDGNKLIAVKNWGTYVWTSFQEAFFGCYSLTELPSGDAPNLSQVTSFLSTFQNCKYIENWGTISEWDFSNVTQMASMLNQASTSVPEISNFNISNWDVSNVTDLRLMYKFYENGVQTADIGNPNNWNVSNVIILIPFTGDMNIDTSTWNFSSWDISSATNASVFNSIGLTTDNYDATLISWAAQPVNNNVTANFGSSKYSLGGAAEAARNILINTYNWTISDGGGVYKPVSGLLFDYPSPTSAYSLRALATFQGGISPVVARVRRSSDNVEQDFTSTEITDGTLISFTGANDGFVVKIYDQSYYLEDIYQNTATRQAKIVNAGSLILEGGLPCIQPAGGYRTVGGENLNYYTNEDTFTYHLQKPDGAVVANNEFFIDSAGAAEYGREGFSFGNNYARINYPYGSAISSISYSRDLTDDIYQPLVWESYPSSLTLNDRLKLYNQDGLLADGNTSNTTPTGQGSTRVASFFASEGSTFRTLEGNWQETILYKEENIPNRDNFLTSISEYYNFPATSGLLFDYPGASAAYSLRNLANNVTNVVRVRRSSDNTEQDFTSAEITDGTLTTFTGANDGFVTTWYDQSGNSNNAAQATAVNQPKLVDSGVLQLDNSNPAINFSLGGSNSFTLNSQILDVKSVFQVLNAQPNTGNYRQFILAHSSRADYHSGLGELLISSQWASNAVIDGKHYINQQQYDFTSTNKPTNQSVLSLIAETSTGVNRLTQDRGGNSGSWQGKMQEIILYPTDESANKSGIEKNINTKYNIYPENTAISGLLFDYPNASAAYSLRQLTTFNTGFKPIIVKVRRSSDNTEQTFTATEITDGTLTTFTGANDGFVVAWYDQSGNMGWAKQQTAANQPKIVSSGVVELENGKPTLRFDGTNKLISNTLNINSQPNSYFIAFKSGSGESIFDGSGNRNALFQYQGFYRMYANAEAVTSFSTTSSMVLSANLFNGSNSFMSLNGVLESGFNVGTSYQRGLVIGGNGTINLINGTVSEFIMYSSDQSANRVGIETNINTQYTIY